MKIVFLDIDGVLVNRASFRLPRTSIKGYDATAATAHPDCVAALNRIIEATDARLVISSVWRMHGVMRMREILKTWGVRGTVIGCTPDLTRAPKGNVIIEAVERGHEIHRWLDSYHRTEIEAFAILDDDSDMNGLSPYLIQTQFEPGLTLQDAKRAIRLLNGKQMPDDLTKHGFLPRCEGCALNPQTDANRSDVTRLKAKLCVEALEPFFCHEEVQEAVKNGLPYSEAVKQIEMPLCSGWCEAVATRNDSGFYESQEEWRRAVQPGCLEYLVKVEDGFDPGDTLFPPELFSAVQKELARVENGDI